ncbi:MAG TPA: protein kinase [Candidatus Eisenbacteria bacterium]|nr:protein kinase [Candidatus Eisenbacteria bacterium]
MVLSPKTRLGTYEILAPLGAGGMGEVYRARDLRLGRDVAVKVLPAEVASSSERLARFEREARAVAGLNHPNIVTLYSVEDEEGIPFLTMELIEGQSLSSLVTPSGLPFPRLLELAIPIADALVAAHERGVIHRDLKPGNVMVTRDGRVKVLDFGLAKLAREEVPGQDGTVTSPISDDGQVLGTVPYMSPEQVRGEGVDARSDLFALGIMLYELATGRRPFAGSSNADLASSILRDAPAPLRQSRSDLPTDLDRIIGQCLEKNPRERVQTALDVSNALRRLHKTLDQREPGTPATKVASIAVLPFVNRSASADDEYFSDGLADELLNVLSKIHGLRVSARASSFHFRGKDVPPSEIGAALRVETLLDGTVRKAGNRVRISVQLVKVSDGYHLWSETYDRTLDDIFAVQDDIAHSVVKELRAALLGEAPDSKGSGRVKAEVAKAARGRGQNTEALRLALQGRHMVERLTPEDVTRGIGYLEEALRLDPENAIAWVDLSRAHLNAAGHGWEPAEAGVASARDAARRAISIEPNLPEGYMVLARVQLYFDWDWKAAKDSYRRAIELAPGNAVGIHGAGILAQNEGRIDEALELYRRAVEQDPLSSGAYSRLGTAYHSAGRLVESEVALRKAIELAPHRVNGRALLAYTLLAQGRLEEALHEAKLEGESVHRHLALVEIYHAQGRTAESDAALRRMIETEAEGGAYQIAEAYAARAEIDSAFEWLERAYSQRDPGLAEIKGAVSLRVLHADRRWGAFLSKMGLDA